VVAALRQVRLVDVVVVLDQIGIPLVGLAADEAVEAVEPRARGQFRLVPPIAHSSTGTLWFFPIQ
jgi:hypothetical protein